MHTGGKKKAQEKEKLVVTAYSLEHITFHTKLLAKVEQGEKREPQKFITNLNIHKRSVETLVLNVHQAFNSSPLG